MASTTYSLLRQHPGTNMLELVTDEPISLPAPAAKAAAPAAAQAAERVVQAWLDTTPARGQDRAGTYLVVPADQLQRVQVTVDRVFKVTATNA